MQSLIDEAVKNAELEKTDTKSNEVDDFIGAPRIMVIGCPPGAVNIGPAA